MMKNSYTDIYGVYRNKLGITDAAELKLAEYAMTSTRSDEILSKQIDLGVQGFGLPRLQAIHHHLFQDVYEWAGKTRTVPSSKRMDNGMLSVFANPDTFEPSWNVLEQKINTFIGLDGMSFREKHGALADIFIEANAIHPFPEGNGRTLQVFMKELASRQGIELNYGKVNPEEWNRASAISGTYGELIDRQFLIPERSNPFLIKKIFASISSPVRKLDQTISKDKGWER